MSKKKVKTDRYSYGDSDSSAELAERVDEILNPAMRKSVKHLRKVVKKALTGKPENIYSWEAVDVAAVLITSPAGDMMRDAAKQEFHHKPWEIADTAYAREYLQLLVDTEKAIGRTQVSMSDGKLWQGIAPDFRPQVALLRADLKRRIRRMKK